MRYAKILLIAVIIVISHAAITVNQISGVSNDNLVFSGTIPVGSNNLFFTYYGADGEKVQDNLKNFPLLIIVGNPGTSAQYYSLSGIGPVNLNNDMTLSPNPNRFTTITNLMFIDLLGSGFSFAANTTDLPSDAKTFGSQLTEAINTFVKESVLGKIPRIFIAGQGTFIRSLSGLNDIDALKGIIHLSAWPEIYAMGRFYGIAGLELKIFTQSQRIAVDSTFTNCYSYIRSGKYLEGHNCLDAILNFVESKTKNCNLFDVRKSYNLTEFLPMVQYYFSQPSVVAAWKAPTVRLFQSQSGYIANKTYVDVAKNYTKQLSQFMKDYYSVKHWFVQGTSDYISYYKGLRNWVQTQLSFVQSDAFKKAKLEDLVLEDKTVGYVKTVKQVAYTEIFNAGHHSFHDQPYILRSIFFSWIGAMNQEIQQQNLMSVQ